MSRLKYKTTKDLKLSNRRIDQVIGQEEAIKIVKKAAYQRRNVLLIGKPGTGKSLLGQALSELLPNEHLKDIVAFANPSDENVPLVKTFPRGKGKSLVSQSKLNAMGSLRNQNIILLIFVLIATIIPYYFYSKQIFPFDSPIVYAASMITSIVLIVAFMLFLNISKRQAKMGSQNMVPKLLIDSSSKKKAPFFDATGAHAGALLGDVLHDPLQSLLGSDNIIIPEKNIDSKSNQYTLSINEIKQFVDSSLDFHKKEIIKKDTYEACFLDKDEFHIMGCKDGSTQPVEVLSVNRYIRKKDQLYKITTESGKEIIVTKEHKIPIPTITGKKIVEACKLKVGTDLFVN